MTVLVRSITRPLMTTPDPAAFALICLGCFIGGIGDGGVTEATTYTVVGDDGEHTGHVEYHCHTCGVRYEVPSTA